MPMLRFNTDEGQAAVAALRQAIEAMQAELNRAGAAVEGLAPAHWQAPVAEQFIDMSQTWQQRMSQSLERLTDLTRRLETEIVQWEEAAAVFGGGSATGGAVGGMMFFEPVEGRIPEMPGFEPAEGAGPETSEQSGSVAGRDGKTFADILAEDASGPSGKTRPAAVKATDTFLADRGITDTVVHSYSETRGEAVVGDDGQNKYYRHSYNETYRSNCTWYAAAAVAEASDGTIDLQDYGADTGIDNLGNGGEWAGEAREWIQDYDKEGTPDNARMISGVDKIPQAGDVYCDNNYHVAFVEEVRTSADGEKIYVVVSEENAGMSDGRYVGQPVGGSDNSVDISPADTGDGGKAIKRYRRVIEFNNASAGTDSPPAVQGDADFIHINYDYQPPAGD